MENQPPVNRELLIPILIGGLSIVGIVVVFMIGRSMNAPAQVATTPSATPFQYIYLGTEPAISTPFVDSSELPPVEETSIDTSPEAPLPGLVTPTQSSLVTPTRPSSVSTPLVLGTPNPTRTSGGVFTPTNTPIRFPTFTPTGGTSVGVTYDDTDSRLVYSGDWSSQTNVSGANQSTLHVSTTRGNTVTFTFTGAEIYFYYQPGSSLGRVAVTIDSLGGTPFSQNQGTSWWSGQLDPGTHSIVIEHFDGGSINIDSLMIPAATPTPGPSPTPTPTQ